MEDVRHRRRLNAKQLQEERNARTEYDLARIQLKRLQENIVSFYVFTQ